MPSYLVESYAAGNVVEDQRERARRAAELGTGVRYVRTTFLPGDETILHLFEAPSLVALRRAAQRGALPCERIVEAVKDSTEMRRVHPSTDPQPRRRLEMKRTVGLILALTLAGAFAVASQARTADSSPLHGALHATKECSEYNGQAGSFCTITGSNLPAIPAGSKVFYLEPAGATALDSDLVLDAGAGNAAFGHVTLSFITLTGSVTLTDGTGTLQDFHARVHVRLDKATNLWHWDGAYGFGREEE